MYGAIIGDIVGSIYEFHNIKTKNFPIPDPNMNFTDDSLMTIAVADWLLRDNSHSHAQLEQSFVDLAFKYPTPMGGYGSMFADWLDLPSLHFVVTTGDDSTCRFSLVEQRQPYNSFGNGAGMRVSPVGWWCQTLDDTLKLAEISASITHNHPEGIKGAQVVAGSIFLARSGATKDDIRQFASSFGYDMNRTSDQIRPNYTFDGSCQGTVPEALISFLDSTDYEDCIRIGVSLGGDSDTLCAIAGSVAEAYYKHIPPQLINLANKFIPEDLKQIVQKFYDHLDDNENKMLIENSD